jgi:hypothetical protein
VESVGQLVMFAIIQTASLLMFKLGNVVASNAIIVNVVTAYVNVVASLFFNVDAADRVNGAAKETASEAFANV